MDTGGGPAMILFLCSSLYAQEPTEDDTKPEKTEQAEPKSSNEQKSSSEEEEPLPLVNVPGEL